MAAIQRDLIVPYTPGEMFDLVNGVEDYPHFVPWCKSAEVLKCEGDELHARLSFARGSVQKSLTTRNLIQKDKMIEMRLLDGPFRHLEGFWRFDAAEEGCHIRFDMEFEFSNKLLGIAFAPIFTPLANSLIDVFKKRAEVIYGG